MRQALSEYQQSQIFLKLSLLEITYFFHFSF